MKEVIKCDDGKYRWAYDVNLYKNPVIFLTMLKLFGLIILGLWAISSLFSIKAFIRHPGELWQHTLAMLLVYGIFVGLTIIGYLIYAKIMGGKYCVLFEMDDEGIDHIQMEAQVKKAELIGAITAMAGAAAGKPGMVGTGLLAATKSSMSTRFSNVKRMKVLRGLHTIKLNGLFNHNQVYVGKEDFDFVESFIRERVNCK